MTSPAVAQKAPFAVDVEVGKTYFWCACGLSRNQPFCDGSHAGTDITPKPFRASSAETVYFCGCKQTGAAPLCDGTHNGL